MGQVLHGSARTTAAVRRALQRSEKSVRALARRYGISPTTVQKWRKREAVTDGTVRDLVWEVMMKVRKDLNHGHRERHLGPASGGA